jgi:hypothetical protein
VEAANNGQAGVAVLGHKEENNLKNEDGSWVPVAHTYYPSYSRGRNQEDCDSKPAKPNGLQDSILGKKTLHNKRASGVAQSVRPEFKRQYYKKKKKVA